MEEKLFKDSSQKILHFVAIILYLFFVYICAPIFAAFFLSSFCIPILNTLEKHTKTPYFLLIFISSLLIAAVTMIIFYIIYSFGDHLLLMLYKNIRQLFTTLENIPLLSFLISPLQQAITDILSKIAVGLQLFIHYIFDFLLFIIAFYFSLVEGRHNRFWYFIYTPKQFRDRWQHFFQDALNMFSRYFSIELKLMLVTAAVLSIGFSLLQFEHPIIKAIILAILDCIPFFGISLVIVPCIIYFLLTKNVVIAVGLVILLIVTIVIRQLLDTYLWSAVVKIKTIHTFFISGVSLLLFGIYGIVISPLILLIVMKLQLHYERR